MSEHISDNTWSDTSPHDSKFIVANGVNLHYLDWGGKGETLLFLAGMGDSAHIFDEIAPQFTDHFRVLAMTRRGHGQSGRPDNGYELPILVQDIHSFLNCLQIPQASIVGHSMAGDETTLLSNLYPDRIRKLVYLDSSLHHLWLTDQTEDPLASPPPMISDFVSLDTIRSWLEKQFGFWTETQEANLRATLVTLPDGTVRVGLPHQIGEALTQSLLAFQPKPLPNNIPALGFFSVMYQHPNLAPDADEETCSTAQAYIDIWRAQQLTEIEFFQQVIPQARIIELPDSHHYLFVQHPDRVVHEMRTFLLDSKLLE